MPFYVRNSAKMSYILDESDVLITTPVRWFCCGPSGSGKTSFLKDLIKNWDNVFKDKISNIVFCYGVYQPLYDDLKKINQNIIWVEGFPSYVESCYLSNKDEHDVLILDDLLDVVGESKKVRDSYEKNSHHLNYSIITVTQNPFYKSTNLRHCSIQCSGFILFKCFRDQTQIQCLSRQIFGKDSSSFLEAFHEITKEPYGYSYVDFSPDCKDILRIRGNIIPTAKRTVFVREK